MSRIGSQQRTLIGLLRSLRPQWRRDSALAARIDTLLRGDRRLGSRDRRLYRELIYTALRYLPWVEALFDRDSAAAVKRIAWLASDGDCVREFRAETAGDLPPCPAGADAKAAILGTDATGLLPGWFYSDCPGADQPGFRDTLLERAPLWLRLSADRKSEVIGEFERLGWSCSESTVVPGALCLPRDADVSRTDAYLSGRVEIQDAGSQRILQSVSVAPGGRWLDACAGAGGKALQLAALLGSDGRVVARDLRPSALAQLRARAERAGLLGRIAVGVREDPEGGFDGVLVDAPCSGSGTWRRAPHLKWTASAASVQRAARLQVQLLRENFRRVRPGGILVYSTCSLCRSENESVVELFLRDRIGAEAVVAGKRLLPSEHNGDGYFVASLRRAAS